MEDRNDDKQPSSPADDKLERALAETRRIARDYAWPVTVVLARIVFAMLRWLLRRLWAFTRDTLYPLARSGYMRLPKPYRIPAVLLAVLLVGVGCSYVLTSGVGGKRNPAQSAFADLMAVTDTALLGGSPEERTAAATDILAASGFDVLEGDAAPRDGVPFVIPPELTMLTYDAGRKPDGGGRLTLRQFAQMMADFGFPFAEGKDPADLLESGIRHWVRYAQEDPSLPGASAPLFLAQMAKAQVPFVDLAADDWTPDQYRLTLLEMQVFLGAFYQAMPDEEEPAVGFADRLFGTRTAYAAETPAGLPACAALKQWFGDWGKKNDVEGLVTFDVDLVTLLTAELTGKGMQLISGLIDQGIAKVLSQLSGVKQQVAQIAGKVLQVINLLLKLQKLAMLYAALEVKVTPDQGMVHMPGPSDKEERIRFKAVVGVNDEAYQAYLGQWNASKTGKDIKDCLSAAGLPSWTDSSDIAADVDNGSVEWDIVEGGGTLVTWGEDGNDFEYKGQAQTKVSRSGKNKGETFFTTTVVLEKVKNHRGEERIDTAVVQASVETAGMPPILTQLVNGGKIAEEGLKGVAESALWGLLGIVDTLADTVTGWYQMLVKPAGYGYAHITYHEKDDGPLLLGRVKSMSDGYEQREGTSRERFEQRDTSELVLLERLRLERDEYGNERWVYRARYTYSARHTGNYIPHPNEGDSCPADFRDTDVSWSGELEARVMIPDGVGGIQIETDVMDYHATGYDCYNPELDQYAGMFSAYIPYEGETGKLRGSHESEPSVVKGDWGETSSNYRIEWDLTLKWR